MIKTILFPIRLARWTAVVLILGALLIPAPARAADLDTIGLTALRLVTTNLNGSGVRVAQVEPEITRTSPSPFEVSPGAVGLPAEIFSYFVGPPITTETESAGGFPNSVGSESTNADIVGGLFYGIAGGVSTNVVHIDNYEADNFFDFIIPNLLSVTDSVVNQSFTASASASDQMMYDSYYDNFAAHYNLLFVTSAGDSGPVSPPATCYNGLGVAAYGGVSSVGPTADNGRAKPDLTAPGGGTGSAAPLVSGAAAILWQAGARGDGGGDTNSAADQRTIKALLMNGAIKPADWSNPSQSPLDPRYGAGIVNILDSYRQLAGGKHAYIESGAVPLGTAHPPLNGAGNVGATNGWDYNTNTSSAVSDGVNHYYFNLTNDTPGAAFTGTMTLVWDRQAGESAINNLDLFLYDTTTGNLMASSTSVVDNVQHIYLPSLPPGRYHLQVLKHGGSTVSASETYALAFEFFNISLGLGVSGSDLQLTWPVYPAGFRLESTGNLNPPATWSANFTPVLFDGQYLVTMNAATGRQFFRLVRP